jgi:hypothetical protein
MHVAIGRDARDIIKDAFVLSFRLRQAFGGPP